MTLRLNGNTSGFVEIQAPSAAGDNSITLPADNGSPNELLKNATTAGELEFADDICIDNSSRLLVGGTTSRSTNRKLQIAGNGLEIYEHLDSSSAATLLISKGRGTLESPVIVNSGDTAGQVQFRGYNGTNYQNAAMIRTQIEGTPSETSMPGTLTFLTRPAVGANPVARVEVGPEGEFRILSGCPGIDFSRLQPAATNGTMTSETLDAYEEGTWTPAGGNNFNGITNADGSYVRVGNIVWISFQFNYTSLDSATDTTLITGLPFAAQNANPNTGVEATGVIFGTNKLVLTYIETNNTVYFEMDRPIAGSASAAADFMRGSMVYRAA